MFIGVLGRVDCKGPFAPIRSGNVLRELIKDASARKREHRIPKTKAKEKRKQSGRKPRHRKHDMDHNDPSHAEEIGKRKGPAVPKTYMEHDTPLLQDLKLSQTSPSPSPPPHMPEDVRAREIPTEPRSN